MGDDSLINSRPHDADEMLLFGPFRLFPRERRLERQGQPLSIGSRALDILITLINEAGAVIDKRALMAKAWQNMVVDESNLRVNIAVLRKALGEGENGARYVANISGRGYSFVAKVQRLPVTPRLERRADVPRAPAIQVTVDAPMLGRDETLRELMTAVMTRRCVTLVGPGGVGKSMLATHCAKALIEADAMAVHCLDLDSLHPGSALEHALAHTFGLDPKDTEPLAAIQAFLVGKPVLLLLDNADAWLDRVAHAVETLCASAPQLHVLISSREALRIEGEQVCRLDPLPRPSRNVARCPVIQLFMAKSQGNGAVIEPSDDNLALVVDICERLDGLPLAVAMAAARVSTFGLKGTRALLDSTCRLHWPGRRNAVPRQQSLQATFDYSYHRLGEHEKNLFLRLSHFEGLFTLEAVLGLVSDEMADYPLVIKTLDALVGKSLVVAQPSADGTMHYALLETLRIYALERIFKAAGGGGAAGSSGSLGENPTGTRLSRCP